MALQFPPKKRAVYMRDFKGMVPPEMVKTRPVIVVSASKARPGLATVIPFNGDTRLCILLSNYPDLFL